MFQVPRQLRARTTRVLEKHRSFAGCSVMRKQCEKCGTWVALDADGVMFESSNAMSFGVRHDKARCSISQSAQSQPQIEFKLPEAATVSYYPDENVESAMVVF